MSDMNKLVALITGASDGIGKETARQLAAKGILVILGSRNLEKGQDVVQEFKQNGLDAEVVQLDTTDVDSVGKSFTEVERRHGKLDILINNAGIAIDSGRPLSEVSLEDITATFETNVFGSFHVTRTFLPLLQLSARGRIVNVSSSLGSLFNMTDKANPYYHVSLPSYAASKAALNVMTIHLARELQDTNIKINAVCPGLTATRYVKVPGAQSVEVGAETPVHYALLDDDGPSGGFFDRNGPIKW